VTLGLAGAVAVRLGKLPIELLMAPPHPAVSNPATSRVTERESLFAERRMLILPRRVWPTAGAAWLGGFCSDPIVTVRRRAWGQIWRFRRRVPLLHPAPERFGR
jgi:hypothetical protein